MTRANGRARRRPGTGSVLPRGENAWRIRWEGPPKLDGSRRHLSATVHGTRAEAEQALRQRQIELHTGTWVEPQRLTLAEFLDQWQEQYVSAMGRAPRTQEGYAAYVRRYIHPTIGGLQLQDLQPMHLQALYGQLLSEGRPEVAETRKRRKGTKRPRQPLSASTVHQLHRILHKALGTAVKWRMLERNPADAVELPRRERPETAAWDEHDVRRFLAAVDREPQAWARDWFRLALYTGMRRSELAGLRWPSVDLGRRRIRVVETLHRVARRGGLVVSSPKTKKSRRAIAVDDPTVELVSAILKRQQEEAARSGQAWNPEGYVLSRHDDGKPLDPGHASRAFTEFVAREGLPTITLHGLRHTLATLCLVNGVPLKVVSERLGHSDIGITGDIYSHVPERYEEEVAARIGSFWIVPSGGADTDAEAVSG